MDFSKEAQFRNNLKRVERIEKFRTRVRLLPGKDGLDINLEFSEPIVVSAEFLEGIDLLCSKLIIEEGEDALPKMSKHVTRALRNELLLCTALFEDEAGVPSVVAGDDEVVEVIEDIIGIYKPKWE